MPTRKRIKSNAPGTGGGGSTPTFGNVAWGPDFGEGAGNGRTWNVGVDMDLDAIAVANTKTVGVAASMPALAYANTKTVGVDMSGDLGYANTKTVGVDMSGDLGYANTKTVGVDMGLAALGAANTKTVGAHLSGTVVAAPFWQSVATNGTTGTGITIAKPSGTVQGDFLLAFITTSDASAYVLPITPSGWTFLIQRQMGVVDHGAVRNTTIRCYWKFAGSSEGSSYAWTMQGGASATHISGELHRVVGVNTTTPINATAASIVVASGLVTDPAVTGLTTTTANCLVFAYLFHDHLALTQSHTPPASHVELTDFENTQTSVVLGYTSATRVFAAAGGTGTATFNCTETVPTDAAWIRVAIAPGTLVIAA